MAIVRSRRKQNASATPGTADYRKTMSQLSRGSASVDMTKRSCIGYNLSTIMTTFFLDIAIILVLILINGFFALSELAIVSCPTRTAATDG